MKKNKHQTLLLEQFKKTPIVQIACEKVGVGRASYYRWRRDDPEFAKAADDAITEGLLFMNDMAESQLLSAVRDRNLPAITFWLKNHHPSYKTRVEISGEIKTHDPLTDEQKKLVEDALKLLSLGEQNDSRDSLSLTPPDDGQKRTDSTNHQ